jgi:hypothetical protein
LFTEKHCVVSVMPWRAGWRYRAAAGRSALAASRPSASRRICGTTGRPWSPRCRCKTSMFLHSKETRSSTFSLPPKPGREASGPRVPVGRR